MYKLEVKNAKLVMEFGNGHGPSTKPIQFCEHSVA